MLVGQVFSPSDEVSSEALSFCLFTGQHSTIGFDIQFETHTKSTEFEFIYAGSQKMEKDMLAHKWENQLILYKKVECVSQVV